MDVYATEEQQWDAIKKWFSRYGSLLSTLIIILMGIILSFQYWRHHQAVVREAASEQYITLMDGVNAKEVETVNQSAQKLLSAYPTSPYASLAAFALASQAERENDPEKAKIQLQWILDKAKQADFKTIARIRLMRILMAQDKLDEAMALYDAKNSVGFMTLMDEIKGDILLAKNDPEGAKSAYQSAYHQAPEEGIHGPLLKMKIESLGVDPAFFDKQEGASKR